MIRCVVAALGIMLSSALAHAECPGGNDPTASEVPCGITLVGTTGGIADPRGQFRIVVRDLANNPVPNCEVMIDFGACKPDIRIATHQPHQGLRVECDANGARVFATTDANGTIVARIVGAASAGPGGPAAAGFKCATVYAGRAILGSINVAAFDLNGGGGSNPADVSLFLQDFFEGGYKGRSDYDCSNAITPADLSLLLQAGFGAGSLQSGGSYCF